MVEAEAHVGVGGEMKNKIAAGHCPGERRQIEVVAFEKFETRIFQRAIQKFCLAGGKIVPTDDRFTVGEQAVNEVTTDEASGPGHEYFFHVQGRSLTQAGKSCQLF